MKKKHAEEHENLERWLVSYADFITLLFAFFTVLYALSQTDKAKYKNAVENIQRSFLSSGGIFPLRGTPFTPFEKPADKGSALPIGPTEQGQLSKTSSELEDKRVAEQIRGLFERATGLSVSATDVEVVHSEDGFRIRLAEYLLFHGGSDKIKRENVPFLFELGKRLAKLGLPVQIEGHTDTSTGESNETNWQLSLSRSYHVVQFLVEAAGFPPGKISLAGYGDSQPIADNDSPQGRNRNRRVEIAIRLADRKVSTIGFDQ